MTDRLDNVGAACRRQSEPDVDGPDELRELIRNILASIAAYERAVIRGRMMAGRRAKAAEGRYVGGIPRFGYSTSGGELVSDEREQAVVARIGS